ncbi:MAG: hypothetical protein ACRD44_04340 [Bryobacteraceae bacterium]
MAGYSPPAQIIGKRRECGYRAALAPRLLRHLIGGGMMRAAAGLVNCYAPARRAPRVDPVVVLRQE